ncbi:uncharacterized protein LOC121524567 [Cheilinus undulatus]|uniref:uncharacterized protein LOC121524567 n=1 Tax=Cheilinus undulatus TaxID=241271 RepID=UPI001BD586F7|nr:uncharacterized protein LOC121524567 [Cheilinus undulatus]
MKLFTAFLLMLGLFLSSSAQTLDECRPLVTPYSTFEPSFGRWNFIIGYIDSPIFQVLFDSCLSQWIEFRRISTNPKELVEDIGIKHPTYCKYATSPMTLHLNTAVTDKSNFTCTYHSLPTCQDCLLYMVNSRNNDNLLHLKTGPPQSTQDVKSYRALYLMARGVTLDDKAIQYFKKQAWCLGFKGEPSFHYNPMHPFCEYTSKSGSYDGNNYGDGNGNNHGNFQNIYHGINPGNNFGRNHGNNDDVNNANSEEN